MRTRGTRLILLVDDHAGVRHGLALVLAEEGVGECREAAGREEALAAALREPPDAALVDLSPCTEDALKLVVELCARNIPVLVCSMHEEPCYVRRALAAGARGYITKREAPRDLARAQTCFVTDTSDDPTDTGSLRYCVTQANTWTSAGGIWFSPWLVGQTITLSNETARTTTVIHLISVHAA